MATSLPYLASNKNVATLFEKIASAKVPGKFTQEFLQSIIGLKGTNDRQLIPLLRNMGFLDQSSTPTSTYSLLKNQEEQKTAIANGIRQAYAPLFDANEAAHDLPIEKLKGLVSQVAGTDADMSARISSTFAVLTKLGDFNGTTASVVKAASEEQPEPANDTPSSAQPVAKPLRTEFHYDINVHLPANASEDTYLSIFNAIRKTFQ